MIPEQPTQPHYPNTYHHIPVHRVFTLKELRQLSHMTVDQIASELDITHATLYAWEKGTTQIPILRLRDLLVLYKATTKDVNWEHLFNQIEKNKRGDD